MEKKCNKQAEGEGGKPELLAVGFDCKVLVI